MEDYALLTDPSCREDVFQGEHGFELFGRASDQSKCEQARLRRSSLAFGESDLGDDRS